MKRQEIFGFGYYDEGILPKPRPSASLNDSFGPQSTSSGSHRLFSPDPYESLDQLTEAFGNSQPPSGDTDTEKLIDFRDELNVFSPIPTSDDQNEPNLIDFTEASMTQLNLSNKNAVNISAKKTCDAMNYDPNKLPRQAIIYDYTVHPLIIIEKQRRPIFIDGVGVIKSFYNCCTSFFTPKDSLPFPLVPLVRCLFYWISKGHRAVICFDKKFNPLTEPREFRCTDKDMEQLKMLNDFKLLEIYTGNPLEWYKDKLDNMRACMVTTVQRWARGLPPNMDTDHSTYNERKNCHDRLLQPFFANEGNLVFFSSFTSKRLCVANLIIDNDINSREEFERFQKYQLSFIDQCKCLKLCFDLLPHETRQREAHVMVEVLKRLKNFLI